MHCGRSEKISTEKICTWWEDLEELGFVTMVSEFVRQCQCPRIGLIVVIFILKKLG